MALTDYLRVLARYWIFIAACTLFGLLTSAAVILTTQPTYTSKTQLFVAIQNSGSVTELQQGNTFSQARVKSYVETATTPVVLQPVIDDLGLETTPTDLSSHISASADLNTVIITITASDDSPTQAAALAQGVATSLVRAVEELERSSPDLPSPVRLSVVTPAVAPVTPSSPNVPMGLMLGTFVGLAAGIAFSFLRSSVDHRIRGIDDVQRATDLPVLGGITYDSDVARRPLLTQTSPQSPRAEAFRQIRTNLQFANIGNESKVIVVSSSLPGEGKTTTATNMAIVMAQAGQRVVLVDADLRRPMVAKYLGLEGSAGVTTALLGKTSLEDLLQPWGDNGLYVLASGRIPPNPSELLGSDAMSRLLVDLEKTFDIVIVDAPPLIPVTDASLLAQKAGGVVLVVGAGKIRSQDLGKSLESLQFVGANVMGAAINLLPAKGPDAYAYSYYTYDSETPGNKRRSSQSTHSSERQQRGSRRSRQTRADFNDVIG